MSRWNTIFLCSKSGQKWLRIPREYSILDISHYVCRFLWKKNTSWKHPARMDVPWKPMVLIGTAQFTCRKLNPQEAANWLWWSLKSLTCHVTSLIMGLVVGGCLLVVGCWLLVVGCFSFFCEVIVITWYYLVDKLILSALKTMAYRLEAKVAWAAGWRWCAAS